MVYCIVCGFTRRLRHLDLGCWLSEFSVHQTRIPKWSGELDGLEESTGVEPRQRGPGQDKAEHLKLGLEELHGAAVAHRPTVEQACYGSIYQGRIKVRDCGEQLRCLELEDDVARVWVRGGVTYWGQRESQRKTETHWTRGRKAGVGAEVRSFTQPGARLNKLTPSFLHKYW